MEIIEVEQVELENSAQVPTKTYRYTHLYSPIYTYIYLYGECILITVSLNCKDAKNNQ